MVSTDSLCINYIPIYKLYSHILVYTNVLYSHIYSFILVKMRQIISFPLYGQTRNRIITFSNCPKLDQKLGPKTMSNKMGPKIGTKKLYQKVD